MSKTTLVTHKDCTDGSVCAALFVLAGGDPNKIIYSKPGDVEAELDKVPAGDFLIFADVAPRELQSADDLEKRGDVVVLDHHKTSLFLSDRSWCHIEDPNDRCGSVLLYDYLFRDAVYMIPDGGQIKRNLWDLVTWVDDRDRWVNRTKEGPQLDALRVFMGQKNFVRSFVDRVTNSTRLIRDSDLDVLSILHDRQVESTERALDNLMVMDRVMWNMPGHPVYRFGYVFSPGPDVSGCLHAVLERNPDVHVACSIGVGSQAVSIRTAEGYDAAAIAKMYDLKGGGHAAAAGHKFSPWYLEELIQSIHGDCVGSKLVRKGLPSNDP
jgi:uncharacterized protein